MISQLVVDIKRTGWTCTGVVQRCPLMTMNYLVVNQIHCQLI